MSIYEHTAIRGPMHLKNGKNLYNEKGITFLRETERNVNDLNIYDRSKNGTNLWDDSVIQIYGLKIGTEDSQTGRVDAPVEFVCLKMRLMRS